MESLLSSSVLKAALLVSLLAASPGSRSTPAAGTRDDGELAEQIAELVATAGDPPRVSALAPARLTGLGNEALPLLFATLASGELSVRDADETPIALLDVQSAAILDGICGFERKVLRSFLADRREGAKDARISILRILERVGDRHDLALARDVALPDPKVVENDVLARLVGTAEEILRRDDLAQTIVSNLILSAHTEVGIALVEALVAIPSRRSLELLSEMLGYEEELDAALLRGIGEVGMQVPSSVDEAIRANVRDRLLARDARVARDAAITVGKLEDHFAVGSLIDLLRYGDRATRENSLWSLTELTGLRFSGDYARWRWWYEDEERWFDNEALALFDDLREDDPGRIVRALNVLSQRRYRRDEIAREIVGLLESSGTECRMLCAAALSQLGSWAAIPALVELLTDHDEDVREAAWRALRAITAADLPKDSVAWTLAYLTPPNPED